MTGALIYARQSVVKDGGKDSLSLDSQVAQLTARCETEGWRIVGVIRESGIKGSHDTDERPGLAEAIARATAGDYDILLVWDLSRFFRDLYLQEGVVRELRRHGVQLISHTQPHAVDDMLRQFEGMVNERRLKELSAHQKRAIRELQRRGVHHGVVPWGYARPERGRPLVLCERTAPIVREMYELRASGIGPAGIAAAFSRRGIATPLHAGSWRTTTICHMLRHIAYRGAVRAGDELIEDAHPAIVDADLWQRAQVRDTSRRHPRQKTVTSWLDGLVEHVCGEKMYICQPRPVDPRAYFRCRDSGRSSRFGLIDAPPCPFSPRQVRVDRIEPLAWDAVGILLGIVLTPEDIITDAQQRFRAAMPTAEAARTEALSRQSRAQERRNRFLGLYGDGIISRAELDVEIARATAELAEAERLLALLPTLPDADGIRAQWDTLHSLRDVAAEIPDDRRGDVLRALGVAVVSPAGVAVPGIQGAPDAGLVTIRVRSELAHYFRHGADNANCPHVVDLPR